MQPALLKTLADHTGLVSFALPHFFQDASSTEW
jgi:hypothetical protein